MFRLSKLTDYGIVLLAEIAKHDGGALFSARALAGYTGLPLPTVEKLLKRLAQSGLLNSKRGAKGGYFLAQDPVEVSLAQIIDTLQGSIALTECTDSSNSICDVVECCTVRDHWPVINGAIRAALSAVTLKNLSGRADWSASSFTVETDGAPQTPKA